MSLRNSKIIKTTTIATFKPKKIMILLKLYHALLIYRTNLENRKSSKCIELKPWLKLEQLNKQITFSEQFLNQTTLTITISKELLNFMEETVQKQRPILLKVFNMTQGMSSVKTACTSQKIVKDLKSKEMNLLKLVSIRKHRQSIPNLCSWIHSTKS